MVPAPFHQELAVTTNSRTWRWAPLLALTVGALSGLHCIELPEKSFACSADGGCSGQQGPGGEPYVCVSEGYCALPGSSSDGGNSQDAGSRLGCFLLRERVRSHCRLSAHGAMLTQRWVTR